MEKIYWKIWRDIVKNEFWWKFEKGVGGEVVLGGDVLLGAGVEHPCHDWVRRR